MPALLLRVARHAGAVSAGARRGPVDDPSGRSPATGSVRPWHHGAHGERHAQ
jgi:hypothetical protein